MAEERSEGDKGAGDTAALSGKVPNYKFKAPKAAFTSFITQDGSSGYPAEANRYHLYISYGCPWACRCLAVRNMKGLQDVIGVTVVKPAFERTRPDLDEHIGWAFAKFENEEPGISPDPINDAKFIRDLYEISDPENSKKGRYSVPVLWDRKSNTIVNNESSEIMRMLNSEFNHLARNPDLNLYPVELQASINEVNGWVYDDINIGVYKVGLSTTQEDYDRTVRTLYAGLDLAEGLLEKHRYLIGDTLTEADIRLFMTLIRFDEACAINFKCNKRLIREYPNLFNYTKDLFQVPGVGETVDFYHIKKAYFHNFEKLNPYLIIPIGSTSWVDWSAPHNRDRF
ncbi:hypothetical protein O6H91_18G019300 [Diphasiastrum complanatum]|uniref:Uncharacterized protein n=3 Tax=Diphasiastrum complanatum TaxID=34168 RepID=A0ACC2AZU0_DIPCM|nr:hypothetical protein O6H91_Y382500 [Diphasiastrum complanatum]KAJ7522607.1 hypothetical protein O6H91_18G019300 [Diphasiastrum complanatum]KAJ7522608.1 hypothetical protein O6H91_18G019300 [Diphasiastrum complanatum]KAJ7522609.1 hypothetical protein O6H91_18G019300 [Diphasiastrum complanatum]